MKLLLAAILVLVIVTAAVVWHKRKVGKQPEKPDFSEEEYDRSYEAKKVGLERVLGPMHDMVGHAIFPFCLGGTVDMYYFPNGIAGTGFATMELIEPDGSGPKPNRIGTYELAAFTRLTIPPTSEKSTEHPYNKIERHMCGLLTTIGQYSHQTVINPGETCEMPSGDDEPVDYVIFDEYAPDGIPFTIDGKRHCLLLCLTVFESELNYAREHGSKVVLDKLKQMGHYPYSDLDREPVF